METPNPESVNISCPHCSVTLKAKSSRVGSSARCPKCSKEFRITLPELPPTPPPFPGINTGNVRPAALQKRPAVAPTRNTIVFYSILGVGAALVALVLLALLVPTQPAPPQDNSAPTSAASDTVSTLANTLFAIPLLLGMLAFYMLPSIIAFFRQHDNFVPIMIVNIFAGWTMIGWVASLAWCFSSSVRESRQTIRQIIVHENRRDSDD